MIIKDIEQKLNPKTNGFYLFKESLAASQPSWGTTRADYGLEAETNIMPPTEQEFDEGLMLPYKKVINDRDRVIIDGVPQHNAGYGYNGRIGTIRLFDDPKRYWDDEFNSVRVDLDDISQDISLRAIENINIPIKFLKPYNDKEELDEIYWLKNENKQISKWLKTTTEPYDNFYWDGNDLLILKEKIVIETINRNILIENKVISEERKNNKYDYGCLMTYFDIPAWNEVLSMIEPDDIYTEEYEDLGLEREPHATILFGLHDNEINLEDIKKELADINEIPIKINGISHFEPENKPYDVVKFDVESDILHQLNQQIKKFPNTNEYDKYDPHMTIAYVKKGTGQKYHNKFLSYPILIGNRVVYSYPSGKKDVWELPIKTDVIDTMDDIQEGLTLPYKKFPDKYFDGKTGEEFSKSEINKHPLWYKNEYDNNGNLIYRKYSYGGWVKWEYDQYGDFVYYENDDGTIIDKRKDIQEGLMLGYKNFPDRYFDWTTNKEFPKSQINKHPRWFKEEYDNNGKLIYKETYYGYWSRWEYDAEGNVIYFETSDGFWIKKEYDTDGNLIYKENSDGFWEKWKYDEYGNEIYYEDSYGYIEDNRNQIQEGLMLPKKKFPDRYFDIITNEEFPKGEINEHPLWYKYIFNDSGNKIYSENNNGYWERWERDADENIIYRENSDGWWEKIEYNENGNEIYYENSEGRIEDIRDQIQ